jgi:hypothetical protein
VLHAGQENGQEVKMAQVGTTVWFTDAELEAVDDALGASVDLLVAVGRHGLTGRHDIEAYRSALVKVMEARKERDRT